MPIPQDLSWLPKYPSRVIGLVLLGAAFQPYYASSSFPVPSIASWHATYPDRIDRKTTHPSRVPALFQAGRVAIPDAAVPPLSWKAQYPDRVQKTKLPISVVPSYFAVPFARATSLTQSPVYPDRVVRAKVHPANVPSLFFKLEAIPIFLSWKGEQPVRIPPPPRLLSQQAYFFHPKPVPAPDPPGLGYKTAIYPDRIWPKAGLHVSKQVAFAFSPLPIPNPPPPTFLTWKPSYPDQILRVVRVEAPQGVRVAPVMAAVSLGMRWLPTYPSFFRRSTAAREEVVAPIQVGAVIAVPPTLGWQPTYPDLLPQPVPVTSFLGYDPSSIAALLPTPPFCIHWTHEEVTRPGLTNELFTRSRFINEDVTGPDITEEQTCP